jgi:NAD(P)H-flavin reductase
MYTDTFPDTFLPHIARIEAMRDETPDTRTFRLRFREPEEAKSFHFVPGQFVELSVFGCGEAPFCIASSPTRPETFETTIRHTGSLTNAMYQLDVGAEVGIRGPFGNGFDLDAAHGGRHRTAPAAQLHPKRPR